MNIKSIQEQIDILAETFHLNPSSAKIFVRDRLPALPSLAIGWVAVVNWENIFCSYTKAVDIALKVAKKIIRHNTLDRKIDLGQQAKSQRESDIIIIPLILKEGKNTANEVLSTTSNDEFGLSTFEIACLCITHPELISFESKPLVCLGDEASNEVPNYPCVPIFGFSHSRCYSTKTSTITESVKRTLTKLHKREEIEAIFPIGMRFEPKPQPT